MTDNPETTEATSERAIRLGLDCDYVEPKDCGFRGTPQCCRYRDFVSDLRAWLASYSGMNVFRRDAENIVDFLKKAGWKEPS